MSLKAIDLFCGAGGLTRGLLDAGIDVKGGFDIDGTCKYAYEHNNKVIFYEEDISQLESKKISDLFKDADVRVLVGCAPCQPFSNYTYRDKNRENSHKWRLLEQFARIVNDVEPDIISMENVPQLKDKDPFNVFLNVLKEKEYHVSYNVVDCSKYGVPQRRRRLVLLASKYGPISLIPPTHDMPTTVRNRIGHLDSISAGEKSEYDYLHRSQKLVDKNKKRIQESVPGQTWKIWPEDLVSECHKKEKGKTFANVYGRMNWDDPAPTITTQFFNYGSGRFGHPEQDRALSLREGAMLQTFPEDYEFTEDDDYNLAKVAVHIGNAVPVRLGEVIGISIKKHLEENNVQIHHDD
jgi:DNA-methyltransferase (dcm)